MTENEVYIKLITEIMQAHKDHEMPKGKNAFALAYFFLFHYFDSVSQEGTQNE